ncbi:MAG: hypothetical protein QM723_02605 [Myxococcaceae bacterium]
MRYSLLLSLSVLVSAPAFAGDSHNSCKLKVEKDDRVARGTDVVVSPGDKVHDAIAIDGNVTIKAGAHVRNAIAAGGTVTIEDGALVDGDVAVVKGKVKISPKAVVKGSRIELSHSLKVEGDDIDVHINGTNIADKIATVVLDELKDCQIE